MNPLSPEEKKILMNLSQDECNRFLGWMIHEATHERSPQVAAECKAFLEAVVVKPQLNGKVL